MTPRLKQWSKLSKEEKESFIVDRLESLYHRKRFIPQTILDIIAPYILPYEEEYIPSSYEEYFLKTVTYDDFNNTTDLVKTIIDSLHYSEESIEVAIAKSSSFPQIAKLSDITLIIDNTLVSPYTHYQACLLPHKQALPENIQDSLQQAINQYTPHSLYWSGLRQSIAILPRIEQLDITFLEFYQDTLINIAIKVT